MGMKYFLAIFFTAIVAGASCLGGSGKECPRASKGLIDLSHWDFEKDGQVELTGEWEFFWKQLVDPDAIEKLKPAARYARVPGIWNEQVIEGEKLSGIGCATYRLKVKFGKETKQAGGPLLALMVRDMGTAYTLFINGEKKASGGRVSPDPERSVPGYRPCVIDFVPKAGEADIVLHLSNYHHRKGGAWEKIIIGAERTIHDIREKRLVLDFFLIGSIFLIGCYHLVLFTMRRKEVSHLYFGLICEFISIRILVSGEFYLVRMFPHLRWEFVHMLAYLTVFACIPLFFMFLQSLFPAEFNRKVLRIYQAIAIVLSFIVISTSSRIYTHFMPYFHVVSFLICTYGMYALIVALARKRDGAVPFMLGFAVLFASVTNDFLYNNRIIYTGYAVPYGLFLFIFSQAFLLSRRFTHSFIEVENMSKELEGKNLRLLNLDKLKDEFLAAVSHELRTPLHGIIGITQSMIEYSDSDMSDESRRNLGLIAVSGKRLAYLIEDISDFARLKNRDIVLSRDMVDLKTIADIVIALSRPLIGNRNVVIRNEIDTDAPPVFADENRVHQILHNLVGNAVKFTMEGKISASAEVVRDAAGREWMRVSVTDTGIGIPEDRQGIIFEQYRQADDSIQRQFGGAGIGLSISRDLVELHGGTLAVKSAPGQGSEFSFTLPVFRDDSFEAHRGGESQALLLQSLQAEDSGREIKPPDEEWSGPNGRLLIVDDDIINLHVIRNFLGSEKYSVVTVTGGAEAMDMIKERSFDLVLLDIMMPKMSGYEVCAQLRKRFSPFELPVIFLTARSRVEDLVMAFDLGANDYLTKPVRRDELLARVCTLVTLKRAVLAHTEARFKLLQERMSPHFLFNALNTVHALINRNKERADSAVIKLAENYRYLIEMSRRSLVPFEEEWRFVMNYLELEELRYSDTLSVMMKKEGDFSDVLIPPLTIQPLVENSLKHGIWNLPGNGSVRVSAAIDGDRVAIVVKDNGAGLQSDDVYSRSLGNIRKLLNYYFDDVYFSVRNADSGGVEVTISYIFKKAKVPKTKG